MSLRKERQTSVPQAPKNPSFFENHTAVVLRGKTAGQTGGSHAH
jgi:hypothetical protein